MVTWGPLCPPDGNVHAAHCPKCNDQNILQQEILVIDINVRIFQLQQLSLTVSFLYLRFNYSYELLQMPKVRDITCIVAVMELFCCMTPTS